MFSNSSRRVFGLASACACASVTNAYVRSSSKLAPSQPPDVYRLVLTGGPCGGKSTILKSLKAKFEADGYKVFCVPETATSLISGGCEYPGNDGGDKLIEFETALIKLQVQAEDSFMQIARSTGRKSIVVMDRGLLDIPAYLPEEQWARVLSANKNIFGGNTNDALDEASLAKRYDMVLHLVTAADGAEKFYTLSTNAARTETAAQARALDAKVKSKWVESHSNVAVIGNSVSFAEKCERAISAVDKCLKER